MMPKFNLVYTNANEAKQMFLTQNQMGILWTECVPVLEGAAILHDHVPKAHPIFAHQERPDMDRTSAGHVSRGGV